LVIVEETMGSSATNATNSPGIAGTERLLIGRQKLARSHAEHNVMNVDARLSDPPKSEQMVTCCVLSWRDKKCAFSKWL
jgi:hypothetical protein